MTNDMRRAHIQMLEQRSDVIGHLINGTDTLEVSGAPAASRIVHDDLQRARQRLHLRVHPDVAGKAGARNEHERFAAAVRLIVEIDSSGYFLQRHKQVPRYVE